jgi:hypothetical protein
MTTKNFDNQYSNKYKKNLKNRKSFTNMFFKYRLIVFQISCNLNVIWYTMKLHDTFNGPKFNKVWWSIKWHSNYMKFKTQSIYRPKNMFVKYFLFLRFFFSIYLNIGCQGCQSFYFLVVKGSSPPVISASYDLRYESYDTVRFYSINIWLFII